MPLPKWIPPIKRPWNPAYQETYEAMTENERRWSRVVDWVVVGSVMLVLLGFTIFATPAVN